MSTAVSFDLYQINTDQIIMLLERGTIPWKKPWSVAGPPMNAITKRLYQGINLWLLLSLPYESNLYLTWEQLKAVQGYVNRGEKGQIIIYWQPVTPRPETAEDAPEAEKAAKKGVLRYHKVFNVEQCTGIPSDLTAATRASDGHILPLSACEHIVSNMQNRPTIQHKGKTALYDSGADTVTMPKQASFQSSEGYYATLFHELIHSTGHEKRLSRKPITEMVEYGAEAYGLEELIAEMGASYLCSHTGILQNRIENSAAYIAGWLSKLKRDKRFVLSAASQAQKACDYVLSIQHPKPD